MTQEQAQTQAIVIAAIVQAFRLRRARPVRLTIGELSWYLERHEQIDELFPAEVRAVVKTERDGRRLEIECWIRDQDNAERVISNAIKALGVK